MRKLGTFLGLILSLTTSALVAAPVFAGEPPTPPAPALTSFRYRFDWTGVFEETGRMEESKSPYWWLNSGGTMHFGGGTGRTIFGELPIGSKWQTAFNRYNPDSTDDGLHPQNIFRLVTKSTWQNASEEVYFRINKMNLSDSAHRNESNGVLLFNRYMDSANLYYIGVRVDGKAVIKKKMNGTYYTMASSPVYREATSYNRLTNPNLIPENTWIGIRSVMKNEANGAVRLTLYMDKNRSGQWEKALEAVDTGSQYGGAALTAAGYGGIRTDFMDVEFDEFLAKAL